MIITDWPGSTSPTCPPGPSGVDKWIINCWLLINNYRGWTSGLTCAHSKTHSFGHWIYNLYICSRLVMSEGQNQTSLSCVVVGLIRLKTAICLNLFHFFIKRNGVVWNTSNYILRLREEMKTKDSWRHFIFVRVNGSRNTWFGKWIWRTKWFWYIGRMVDVQSGGGGNC